MLKGKVSIIIIIVLAICALGLGIFAVHQSNEVKQLKENYEKLSSSYTEVEKERQDLSKRFQEEQESLITVNSWVSQDGSESIQEWWNKLSQYKEQYAGYLEDNELLEYATEEQRGQLENLLQQIKDSRSVVELENLIQQVEEIHNTLINQMNIATYVEPSYSEITYNNYTPAAYSYSNGSGLTPQGGVNYHDGRTETYYSSNVLYHYKTNEWSVDDEGFYRTDDGYYVVAASDMAQGETFEGSKGTCIVLDTGCNAGVTDYYVAW